MLYGLQASRDVKPGCIGRGRDEGIPKIMHAMESNGSPPPIFDFDEDHSFFMVRLPVHTKASMPDGLASQLETASAQTPSHVTADTGGDDGVHDGVHDVRLTEVIKLSRQLLFF